MADAAVTPIPTPLNKLDQGLFVCGGDDWMIECDICQRRMPPFEPIRGLQDEGLSMARDMAKAEGWTSDAANDVDLCPTCRRSNA